MKFSWTKWTAVRVFPKTYFLWGTEYFLSGVLWFELIYQLKEIAHEKKAEAAIMYCAASDFCVLRDEPIV